MKFGIYQRSYVEGLEAEVARLKERETNLLNTAFSLHGISAPFAPPRQEIPLKPLGRPSWAQRKAALEASERNVRPDTSEADAS